MSLAEVFANNLVVKQGNHGSTVQLVQIALRELGYPLKPGGTGYFGPGTDTAVRSFQKAAGLDVDGDVGGATAAAIDRALTLKSAGKPVVAQHEAALPLWSQAALSLLGTRNSPDHVNDAVIDWSVDSGGQERHGVYFPWCAMGMNHFLAMSGLRGTNTLWALDFNSDLMKKRIGHGWDAVQLPGPAVGAIAPMERSGGGHVTSVYGRDQRGNFVCLGANQSHAVTLEPFARSRLNKGFWWPSSVPLPQLVGFEHLPLVTSDGKLSTNEA